MQTKVCSKCKSRKALSKFYSLKQVSSGRRYPSSMCRSCYSLYKTEHNHITGKNLPMGMNPKCSAYLGIHIAERVLSHYFEGITRMPANTHGYDLICQRGYKIDVKAACITGHRDRYATRWAFFLRDNQIADYFLCIGFNNRDDLEPLHIWLIPGNKINTKQKLTISNSARGLAKWSAYEKPLDKVITCCNALREH
jgi:hypothetical protein